MKRFLSLLYAVLIAGSVVGCSGETVKPDNSTTPPADAKSAEDLLNNEIEGEITVSCYDTVFYRDFLETAAKSFEQKYPGTTIHVDSVSQMPDVKSNESDGEKRIAIEAEEDAQGQSDYISKINTALMSGGGADLFAMDILPFYKYAENGQLEDLQKYMDLDTEFNMDNYRKNIIEALKYNGGQYIFPLDYSFNYYEYDESLFDEDGINKLQASESFSNEQLVEIAAGLFEADPAEPHEMFGMKGYMNTSLGTSMFNELFLENYSGFIDIQNRKASFTDGAFSQLLDTIKDWEDKGYILPSDSAEVSLDDFTASTDNQYYYKLKDNIELLLRYLRKEGWKLSLPTAGIKPSTDNNDIIAGMQAVANGSARFSYSQAYGMNANSKNKRLAWEFIKFMSSQEIQETLQLYPGSLTGLPINNEARLSKAKDGIIGELFIQSGESSANKELTEAQQEALDEYVKTVESFSDMLNTYPIMDTTIDSVINSEVKQFFDGKKSSEDTAKAIQSKAELYLNE